VARTRFSNLRLALAIVGALVALTACPPPPPPDAVFVPFAPPPKPTPDPRIAAVVGEVSPPSPENIPGHFPALAGRAWIGGYYQWNGSQYIWVPSHLEKQPHPRAKWVNGVWVHNRKGWYWVEGYWR
jgi:hypothetical protein